MNYEKAYKESFEAAKGLHDAGNALTKKQMEIVFPELRESEDERIRKLLVWQVYRNIEDETNDLAQSVYDGIKGHDPDIEESIEDWKKCLAYLEKQKEPEKEELVYRLNGLMQDYIKEGKDDEEKEHRFKCYQLFWDALEDTSYFEQEEQKPVEWNEEDEEMLNNIEYILHKDISYTPPTKPNSCTGSGNAYYTHQTEIDWLKSLRPQPKQEWSKEDEMYLSQAIETLEHENYSILADKLKSLRSPKSSDNWKPSEEQMKALDKAIPVCIGVVGRDEVAPLESLYEQLKKLK